MNYSEFAAIHSPTNTQKWRINMKKRYNTKAFVQPKGKYMKKLPRGLYFRDGSPYLWYRLNRKRKSTGTADVGQAIKVFDKAKYEQHIADRIPETAVKKAIPFSQLANDFRRKKEAESQTFSTDMNYRINVVERYFKKLNVRQITKRHLQEFKNDLMSGKLVTSSIHQERKLGNDTINKYLDCIMSMMKLAFDYDYIDAQQLLKCKVDKLPRGEGRLEFLSKEEINRFLEAIRGSVIEDFAKVALYTGMRSCEIRNLDYQLNIDFENNLIRLPATKGGNARDLSMTPELRDIFLNQPTRFQNQRVFDIDYKIYKYHFQKCISKSKIVKRTGFKPHDLRHTFASQLVINGVSLRTVQYLLGHKDISQTMVYAKINDQCAIEGMQKMAEIIGSKSTICGTMTSDTQKALNF